MRGAEAKRVIAARLQADLRTVFADAVVEFAEQDLFRVTMRDGWAASGSAIDDDDEVSNQEVERLVAAHAEDMGDNLLPDDFIEPWPLCPTHRDHPLQPRTVRGRACWVCLSDNSIALP